MTKRYRLKGLKFQKNNSERDYENEKMHVVKNNYEKCKIIYREIVVCIIFCRTPNVAGL